MPVLKTHHRQLLDKNEEQSGPADINTIISNITFDILRDSPGLVADVANGISERDVLETAVVKNLDRKNYYMGIQREELVRGIFDFMFGYGQLQQYIDDEGITDIDGTRFDEFVVKRNGIREKIQVDFGSEKMFDTYCKLIAVRNRGILNENDSHCRVTDEKNRLRVNISIKPRNITGPAISIRKHRKNSYALDDLVELGMLDSRMSAFFKEIAALDASILFCGKGAAGKTTLLRAFINNLPEMERVLIVESDAEIYPDKPYCIEQRVKKQNEGGRSVTLRDLARDGLTMSLDTYCVGEITGDEAWEFARAAFTGHRSLATTHSESAEDAFGRLLTLSKGAGAVESEKTMKEMFSKSIDYIVYLKNFKVVKVLEVCGYEPDGDRFLYNTVFYREAGCVC